MQSPRPTAQPTDCYTREVPLQAKIAHKLEVSAEAVTKRLGGIVEDDGVAIIRGFADRRPDVDGRVALVVGVDVLSNHQVQPLADLQIIAHLQLRLNAGRPAFGIQHARERDSDGHRGLAVGRAGHRPRPAELGELVRALPRSPLSHPRWG